MGNYTRKHKLLVFITFVFTVLSQQVYAQSGSFGSTFMHTGGEDAIYAQHNFVTGSGTINAGIIGSERQPAIGMYSFVGPNGSWINASNTAFVDGYVRTYNTGAFTFPIGDNDKYRPAAVSASSFAAPTTAAYYGVDPGLATTSNLMGGAYGVLPGGGLAFPTTAKATDVGTVDNVEYWDIDGTTPARITLTWDANTPITAMVGGDFSKLTIVGWDGTKWVVIPSAYDTGSLIQNTSASTFTGLAPQVTAGSITTTAAIVPGSFTVYTLAGACPPITITPSLTSATICSGEQVAINYTTVPSGEQTVWTRMPGNVTGLGNVTDFPSVTASTSFTYTASVTSFGCPNNTATSIVTVNPVPVVTPSVCSQTICSGQTGAISFISDLPGTVVHWLRLDNNQSGTGDISQALFNTGPVSQTITFQVWGVSAAPASCPSSTTITCTIVVNPGLNVLASVAAGSGCIGQPLSLSASATGGLAPLTYAWTGPNGFIASGSTPLVTATAAAIHNGTYLVLVTDATGCSGTATVPVLVSNCCSLTATAGNPIVACVGGMLNLTVTAGNSTTAPVATPVSYAWTGPNGFTANTANPTISPVTAAASGLYSVTVTDGQSCTATATVSVTVNAAPSAGEDKTLSICNNETADLATYFPAGGSFSVLSGSMTGTVFSGIASGVGSFTVAYAVGGNGCPIDQAFVTIVVRDCTPLACNYPVSAGKVDATCGNSDGTASVSIGGLPAGATTGFAWSNGKTGPNVTGLAAGVYSVTATITTTTGVCTVVDSVNINDIGAPIGEIDLITSADCLGNNGAVAIDITTGTGPFTISWTGAATGSLTGATLGVTTIPNLAPGSYSFEISSATSNTACSSFLAITIPKDDSDQITIAAVPTNATACGSFSGSIVITATPAVGVTGPYSFSLNGVALGTSALPTYTVTGLAAGVYMVSVSSAGGCTSAEIPVTITETGAPVIAGWTPVNPTCPSDQGQLIFAGGQPTATFLVREVSSGAIVGPTAGISGATSTTLTLPAGTYSIEGNTTASACTSFTTVTITVPEGLNFNVEYTKVNCGPGGTANNDGTITVVQIAGGTGPYSTTVTNAQNQVIAAVSPGVYTNLAPGIYNVKVFDSKGCSGVESVFVTVPDCKVVCPVIPMDTYVVDANCGASDGHALATLGTFADSDVTYEWSNGSFGNIITGLSSGVYSVTATVLTGTFTGCAYVETVNVNEMGGPKVEQLTVVPSSCSANTGTVTFNVTAGTTPLAVTWVGPVSSSRSVSGSIPISSFPVTGLAAGNYVFTFTSANSSCETVLDVTIPVSSSSSITLAATPNPTSSCGAQDGSINLTASGSGPNYTFSLNGTAYTSVAINTLSIPNLPAGVYRVGVTSGANGCQTERIVTINETGSPAVTGWTSQSALCALDQGSLTYAGGSGAGTYRILLGTTQVGTTPENATGPVVFSLPQGVYTIELKNGACTSFQNFTIAGPAGIDFNVQYVAESCGPGGVGNGDGTLDIVQINGGTKPYTISIVNNQGQVLAGASHTNLTAGNYFVSVVDANGCTGNNGALVTVPPCQLKCPPLAFNTSVIDNLCGKTNGEATASLLNVPAGATVTYQWSNSQNGPVASGLTSGVYSVTASLFADNTIYAGCMYVDTVNVNDIGGPVASVSATAGASCTASNGSAAINIQSGTGPFTIAWTGATTGTQPASNLGLVNITGLKAGNYVFTVTDATTSCKSVIDVVIPTRTPNGFTLAITPTNTSGCGASDGSIKVVVSGGTGPFTYSVNGYVKGTSASRTFTASGLPAGVNVVEVMDANGCVVQKNNILINPTGQPAIAGWTKTDALCPQNTGIIQYGAVGGIATDEYIVTIAGTATEIGRNFGNVPTSYSVSGGTYLITRTTSTSCVSVTTITVNQPDGLDFNVQFSNPTCLSPASGSFTVVQPSGGTAPYSYTITGPTGVVSTQASVTSLPAGSYTITMGDSRGCTYSSIKVLTTGSNLTVTAAATPAIVCVGQPISLSATGVGGTTPLTYAWSGPSGFAGTGQTLTATATLSGNYTVVVTDAVGCTAVQSTSVTVGATPTVAATPSTVCVGQTVTLDATPGGTSYAWSGPNFSTVTSSPSATILNAQLTNAGIYSVTITGGNGCTGTASTTVTVNNLPVVTVSVNSNTICVGSSLILTASASPTGSYTYTWSGPNSFTATGAMVTINSALATNSGSYTVIVTSASGCSSSAVMTNPVTVTVCCQPFGLNVLATNANCGQPNGEATVTASGGTGTYSYVWSNGLTGSHVTGLLAGSYTVVVSDLAGCTSSTVVSIGNVEAPQLAVLSTSPAVCLGATGAASVTATGGVAPLSYVWSTGTTGNSLSGVVSGVYSVTVTDSKGCLDITQVTIGTIPGSLTGVMSSTPSACSQASGSATMTASGSSGYQYLWNTGATTASISGLVSGIYSVKVTDAAGCSFTAAVSIDDVSGPSVVTSTTAVLCNGSATGTALALASGGSGVYSYLWSNGATTASLSGLSAGVYSVVVTDGNGCKASDGVTVIQPASILAELSPTTIACGSTTGDITLTGISGGSGVYSYRWSNGMTTASLSGVVAGVYSLTITDSKGCIATGSATLVLPTNCIPPCESRDISLVAVNPLCGQATGTITAMLSGTVAGGSVITTSWRNVVSNAVVATNVMSVSGLAAGSYTVSVTVTNGSQVCSYSAITSLSDVGSASLVVSSTSATDCAVSNGSALLTVSGTGSLTVSYSGPVTGSVVAVSGPVSLSGLSAGQYSVTVRDARGCTAVEDFVIAPKGSVSLSPLATASPASCTGTNGSVTVSWSALAGVSSYSVTVGGQSTVVSGTSATFSGFAGGSYAVTVSVAGNAGCGLSTTSVTVPTSNGPALVVSTVQPLCVGGTGVIAVVSPQGGVVYSLLTSSGTLVSTGTSFTVAPGNYVVSASLAGCVSTTVVTIALPLGIDFNVSVSPGACGAPGSLTVSNISGGTGATMVTVTGPSGVVTNLNNLATGSYTVVVTDANGCRSSQVVSVTATAAAPALAIVQTETNCGKANGEITVTASGGSGTYTYLWSNGATSARVTNLVAGTYTVVVTDVAGCASSTVVTLGDVEGPQFTKVSTSAAICLGATGTASVTATGGVAPLSYVWSNGTTGSSLVGVVSGVYSVTVTDSKGCLDITQVTIGTIPGSLTGVMSSTPSACSQASGSATMTASGSSGYQYLWNTGATTASISGLVAGTYSVTVTDANSCSFVQNVTLSDQAGPSVVISTTAVLCNGSATGTALALASGGSGVYSYLWSNGATTASLSGLSAGVYSVVVTDGNGCKAGDVKTIVQPASILANLSPTTIACGSTTGDITLTSISGGSGVYSYRWSNGMTTSSLSAVVAGTYSLTITDSNGCLAIGQATLVAPTNCPICVDPVLTLTGPVCNTVTGLSSLTFVVSNGASVTASAGTIDLVTNTINNIPLNTAVVITATAGCGVSSETIVTGATCTTCTVAISAGTPVCLNGTTYVASVTASAGSSLTAIGGSFNPLTGLVTGVVGSNVTVIATNGSCIQTRVITAPTCTSTCTDSGPLVSISGPVCDGNGSTYTVNYTAGTGVVVTSNVGNYTLVAGRISNIPLGSGVTITAISSVCSLTQVTQVSAPTCAPPCNLTLAVGAISPVACVGGTISLTATASGATTPVTYVWSGPNFSTTTTVPTVNIVSATAAHSGSYTVVITDANGCSKTAVTPVSVTVTPAPVAASSVVLSICNNEIFDLATRFPAGGTFTELTSSSALVGSVFNGIVSQAGTFRILYTSAVTGCGSSTATATIVVRSCSPPPCNFPLSTAVVDANCGANDGRAQALVGGLPGGATVGYNWSNGASGPQITGLVAGVYSVTATVTNVQGSGYLNGCAIVDTVNVNEIGGPVAIKGAVLPATCPGNTNGQVTLTIQSGTAPFVISYAGPVSGSLLAGNLGNQTVSGLAAGDYVFRITSTVNGATCAGYVPVHIPRDDAARISVTATPTNATACGSPTGSIQYAVALQPGVTAPFTYLLNGQVIGTSSLPTFTLSNLIAGSYVVGVRSADGCAANEVSVLIGDTSAPPVAGWTANSATCPSDIGSLVFAGGQPGTTSYRVVSVVNGGTIATVSGATATTLVLSAGSYAVIRTSTADLCTSVQNLIINAPTGLDFNVQYKAATCGPNGVAQNDGSIQIIQIEGGKAPYSIRILDNNNTMVSSSTATNGLTAGNYIIEVRDVNNCAGIQQLLITIPDCQRICPVLPLNTVVVDANCGANDGTAVASLGGLPAGSAVNYLWSNGQNGPTAVGLSTGIYSVTATVTGTPNGTSIGCEYVGTVNVNEMGGPIPSVLAIAPSRCSVNTGMVSLSLTAGTAPYKVSWTGPVSGTQAAPNPSSVLISNLAPGSYTFVVTGTGSNCQGVINVTVPVSTSADITLTATPTSAGSCGASNGSIAVTVTGGTPNYTYTLNGLAYATQASTSLSIPNLPAGYYTVGVTAANGCSTTVTATIGTTGGPSVTGWTPQSALCPDNSGTLTFAGGQAATVTYRVLLGGTTLIATVPGNTTAAVAVSRGTYVIERRDNNCISSYQSLTITAPDGIDFNVQYTGETCAPGGGSNQDGKIRVVQISGGTGPYTVTVFNSQNQVVSNLNTLSAGQYTVRVTDINSCTGVSSVLITVPPCPQVCPVLTFNKSVLDSECGVSNGTATATLLGAPAGSFVTYEWSNGQNSQTITGLASGTYSVTATVTTQSGVYNGCKYVDVVHVNEIGGPIATVAITTGASCTASNGSVILTLSGGSTPYKVTWTGAATGSQNAAGAGSVLIGSLPAGNYIFSVSAGTSVCRTLVEVTIPHNDTAVMQVSATPTDVTGCGAANGSIALNVTGGTAPFLYTVNGYITLSTTSRTPTFPNLPAGAYSVTVQDANGCSVAKTNVLINTTGSTAIAGWSKTNALCADGSGTLSYVPAPGVATDQYVVRIAGSNTIVGQTAGNVPLTLNLPGGTYLVTRTTSNSCVAVQTWIISQPAGLEINVQYGQPTCTSLTSGSLAIVQTSGGMAPYTTTVTSASGVVANLTALSAGSYTVTVGDANGCTISQAVSLTIGNCNFCFTPYVYLQGALVDDDGVWPTNPVSSTASTGGNIIPLMRDDLRALGIIPVNDPYRVIPYIGTFYPGGLGSIPALDPFNETITNPAVTFANRGENSVVDWVFVEFRDKTTPSIVKYTRSALVLRNGTIVDLDGTSCLNISHVAPGDYYVAVRHRNHLGVMTQTTRSLNVIGSNVTVDFRNLTPAEIWHDTSDPNIVNLYGNKERRDISWAPGKYALWGGNANVDNATIYQSQLNDPMEVFVQITTEPLSAPANLFNIPSFILNGYFSGDVNLNGKTIFQGQQNDTHIIYNIMIQHPSNVLNTPSFIIVEQLP